MDIKKLRLIILKELDNGNTDLNSEVLLTNDDTLIKAAEFLEKEELISGVEYYHSPRVDFTDAHVTLKGEKFLKENSNLFKFYKGLKEIKDWIPGM